MSKADAKPLVLNSTTAQSLQLADGSGEVAAGIDHGGTNPRVSFFDRSGEAVLLGPDSKPLCKGIDLTLPTFESIPKDCAGPEGLPKYTAELLGKVLGPFLRKHGVKRLGYAIAGPVTRDGVVVKAPQIWGPSVTNEPYRAMLEDALSLPGGVVLGNDMWAAAHDIIFRGRRQRPPLDNVQDFVVITVSSGIGSKVVIGGEVQLGVQGLGGEVGHLPILWPSEIIPGRRCNCGGLYCIEAGSSGNSNAYRAKSEIEKLTPLIGSSPSSKLIKTVADVSLLPGKDLDPRVLAVNKAVVAAAKRDDPLALSILSASLRPLARAVAALESQLNIRNFYFVGGYALAQDDMLLRILREHILKIGIIGRSAEEIMSLGRLYKVKAQDWGLRGAAMAAHRAPAD